jgi:hypothetical protein
MVICIIFTLLGCVSGGNQIVDQDNLALPKMSKSFELKQQLSVTQLYGMVKAKQIEGLLPGTYTAFRSGPEGIYFLGTGKSIFLKHESMTSNSFYKGGIWIPNDSSKNVKMFVFYSTKGDKIDHSFGPVVNFLVEKDIGKLNVHEEITSVEFNETIKKLLLDSNE